MTATAPPTSPAEYGNLPTGAAHDVTVDLDPVRIRVLDRFGAPCANASCDVDTPLLGTRTVTTDGQGWLEIQCPKGTDHVDLKLTDATEDTDRSVLLLPAADDDDKQTKRRLLNLGFDGTVDGPANGDGASDDGSTGSGDSAAGDTAGANGDDGSGGDAGSANAGDSSGGDSDGGDCDASSCEVCASGGYVGGASDSDNGGGDAGDASGGDSDGGGSDAGSASGGDSGGGGADAGGASSGGGSSGPSEPAQLAFLSEHGVDPAGDDFDSQLDRIETDYQTLDDPSERDLTTMLDDQVPAGDPGERT